MTVEILSKSDVVKFKKIHFMRNFVNNDDNEIALWCGRHAETLYFTLRNIFQDMISSWSCSWSVLEISPLLKSVFRLFWSRVNPKIDGLKYWSDAYRTVVVMKTELCQKWEKRELLFWFTIYKNKVEQIPFRTLKRSSLRGERKKKSFLKTEFMTFWIWNIKKKNIVMTEKTQYHKAPSKMYRLGFIQASVK